MAVLRIIQCSTDLLVQLGHQVPAADQDGDDPQQAEEQHVEGDEEREEPPHGGELAAGRGAGHQVVRHHDPHLAGPGAAAGQCGGAAGVGVAREPRPGLALRVRRPRRLEVLQH